MEEDRKGEEGEDEKAPAIPQSGPKEDQITAVIGEVGRWQLEKILIVFLAAAPGEKCFLSVSNKIKHSSNSNICMIYSSI